MLYNNTLNIAIFTNKDHVLLEKEVNTFCDKVEAVSVQMMAPDKTRNYSSDNGGVEEYSYSYSVMVVYKKEKKSSPLRPKQNQRFDEDSPF